jgi:parallel beta-helix repeat protein
MRSKAVVMMGTVVALVVGALVLVPGVASASSSVLYVGPLGSNGGNSCQSASKPCGSIDFALSVAKAGATIKLQAGSYHEQVAITKPITIEGVSDSQSVIDPTALPQADTDTDTTEPQLYVVDVKGTSGVTLKDVGVSGSLATPTFDTDGLACGQDPVGIYFHDASGTLTSDAVSGIELPADLFGCQGGQGIYVATDSSSATPSNVTMTSDTVGTYDKNGITCDDPRTVCSISKSTVTGIGSTPLIAQNGIQIWASSATLTSNTVTDNTYDGPDYAASGVLIGNPYLLTVSKNALISNDSNLYLIQDQAPAWVYCGNTTSSCTNPPDSSQPFTISKNTASYATNADSQPIDSGYGDGIDIDSVTQPSSVVQNTTDDNSGNGISLYGAAVVTLDKNTAAGNGDGVYLGPGTASATAGFNSLLSNTVSASHFEGILADTATYANLFESNSSKSNTGYDIQDTSTGSGAEGTNNEWSANTCTTSSPAGLCYTRHAAVRADTEAAAPLGGAVGPARGSVVRRVAVR